MKKDEFKIYIMSWHQIYSDNAEFGTDIYAEKLLSELENSEVDHDFIFEDDRIVIGRYNHEIALNSDVSKDGKSHTLTFYVDGVGQKETDSIDDESLFCYEPFDYQIVSEN